MGTVAVLPGFVSHTSTMAGLLGSTRGHVRTQSSSCPLMLSKNSFRPRKLSNSLQLLFSRYHTFVSQLHLSKSRWSHAALIWLPKITKYEDIQSRTH
ncbi:unnamed protein product [Angiostrongylus costaricensis]|uniref:Secreted protein n=1 Tax=Angiostrongylus costaricensis TaxID=334426 RepID=A0A0R3P9E0_ANGCS|nr:unnamed protein product [Angiostrongylus costaricensis]